MVINLQSRANTVFQREKEIRQQAHYSAFRRAVTPMSQGNTRHPYSPLFAQNCLDTHHVYLDVHFRRRSHTALRSLVDLLGIKVTSVQFIFR